MTKNQAIIFAAALFASYPEAKAFYITSDEQAFLQKERADDHAYFLDKKNPVVITVGRDDMAEEEAATGEAGAGKDAAAKKAEKDPNK